MKDKIFTIILSLFILTTPFILVLLDGLRLSLSDYAYSKYSYIYVSYLTISGLLLVYDGLISHRTYNCLLGVLLFGVSYTPWRDYGFAHFSFAISFLLLSVFFMVKYSKKHTNIKIMLSVVIFLTILSHYILNLVSLYVAEYLIIIPTYLHYLAEKFNKTD